MRKCSLFGKINQKIVSHTTRKQKENNIRKFLKFCTKRRECEKKRFQEHLEKYEKNKINYQGSKRKLWSCKITQKTNTEVYSEYRIISKREETTVEKIPDR